MQDNFDMNDVILNDDENQKNTNIKKILTAIAILVVLFLIVLIIMRFINNGNIETNNELVMPSEEKIMQPEQPKNDQISKPEVKVILPENKTNEKEDLKEVPEKEIQIKPIEKIEQTEEIAEKKEDNNTISQIKTQESKQDLKDETKTEQPVIIKKENESKKEPKKTETKQQVPHQKTIAKPVKQSKQSNENKQKSNKTKLDEKVLTQPQTKLQAGNYIQVLAASQITANSTYMKNIIDKGYNYTLYKTKVAGKEYIKVLVGPYSGAELNKALKDIKTDINKDAFVYKVK